MVGVMVGVGVGAWYGPDAVARVGYGGERAWREPFADNLAPLSA
jgi:hypothetical protein